MSSIACALLAACGGSEASAPPAHVAAPPAYEARLPRAPGTFAPSLVAVTRVDHRPGDVSDGTALADVDSCASCHPDAAAQWSASAHSFASFGNPIYRFNIERVRAELGKPASRHCGGCHDMPLLVDGMMTAEAPVPANDLRAHSGVTCRLCHGVSSVGKDGNGSFAWSAAPIDAPVLGDAASIARHKRQVTTTIDTELCVGCHRGFLSPDLGLPVHLTGIDEPTWWRSSAWAGNGMARIDKVEKKTCIDCHMAREPASANELGAKRGTLASHRFVGGHTWMAAMRGDADQLARTRARLAGAASIDIAGARIVARTASAEHASATWQLPADRARAPATWQLPADGAPVAPGTRIELDVVLRNLLVGHRFPGGVMDVQDTWVELEVADRRGARLAASGLAHERDRGDREAHVLRTLVVDETGRVLEEHEMAQFRSQVTTQTVGPRETRAVRYAFDVPAELDPSSLPLAVTARLRHRSRTLALQAAACREASTPTGRAFLTGARDARDVALDPCAPQPITLIAEARIELGRGAHPTTARPAWERMYEHGMALVGTRVEFLDEARVVLDRALAAAPDDRARAMVAIQLAALAAKQNRVSDALAGVADARRWLAASQRAPSPIAGSPAPAEPPVFDAVTADALVRAWRWRDAEAPARACTERARGNASAWSVYARVLVANNAFEPALAAASSGLALAPRDAELLGSQATALAGLAAPSAGPAQAAYDRFRAPDRWAQLRIRCSTSSDRCWRDRETVPVIVLQPMGRNVRAEAAAVRQARR